MLTIATLMDEVLVDMLVEIVVLLTLMLKTFLLTDVARLVLDD